MQLSTSAYFNQHVASAMYTWLFKTPSSAVNSDLLDANNNLLDANNNY